MIIMIAPPTLVHVGTRGGDEREYGGIRGEEEGDDYGGILQSYQRDVS